MFSSKVPRIFVLASVVLLFLVSFTTLRLYHRIPPTYSVSNLEVAPFKDGTTVHIIEEASNVNDVVVSDLIGGASDPDLPALTPSPTTQVEEQVHKPETGEILTHPSSQLSARPGPFSISTDVGGRLKESNPPLLPNPKGCPDLEFIVRASTDLKLAGRVRYVRRYIQPVFSDTIDRDDVANITQPLLNDGIQVDLHNCDDTTIPHTAPIQLHVPKPHAEATFPHLTFGVATDYSRLNRSVVPFAHWLSHTEAKLVAVVTDAKGKSAKEMEQLQHLFESNGINVTLVKPIDEKFTTSQNHFAVLVNMLDHSSAQTQWYGLLDDDTFFPSLKPLSDSLSMLNHEVDAYVGALSEDFAAVQNFGFMAFGGAGAFLSAPLARKLGEQVLKCIDEATSKEGDIIIRDCVYTNSKAKLTILQGLYQQDMGNDVSGFFEAGLKPLSLHHWKSWYREPVEKMAKAAVFCGDCFLQRWRFGTDTVFSNGFSIAIYEDGVESVDLQSMEGTWAGASRGYDFSIGPLRKPYPTDKKKSYKLRDAELTENGDLRQLYLRVGNASIGELDSVVELVWQKHK
ncbi:glycosyltransferase family 31 protein [Hypoxylon fragiforme]|uniref:glycosyltransferase family 31 protein n=1 Tax=Hypoxylon fragiforme TaxID=63214 RepID=UPI0020C65CE2|nr:glycosyltransferase family 31 protein [Hypoxylon fragiforme]KAI2613466.1 glycosyltransferase family 31 protein [Hypoxylon fragiforme]